MDYGPLRDLGPIIDLFLPAFLGSFKWLLLLFIGVSILSLGSISNGYIENGEEIHIFGSVNSDGEFVRGNGVRLHLIDKFTYIQNNLPSPPVVNLDSYFSSGILSTQGITDLINLFIIPFSYLIYTFKCVFVIIGGVFV